MRDARTYTLHRLIRVKDSVSSLKYSENGNGLSLLLKEESSRECLMSWERLFQMRGAKSENVQKPWNLRFKRWSFSIIYILFFHRRNIS